MASQVEINLNLSQNNFLDFEKVDMSNSPSDLIALGHGHGQFAGQPTLLRTKNHGSSVENHGSNITSPSISSIISRIPPGDNSTSSVEIQELKKSESSKLDDQKNLANNDKNKTLEIVLVAEQARNIFIKKVAFSGLSDPQNFENYMAEEEYLAQGPGQPTRKGSTRKIVLRKPPGSLNAEIRKMSLASQDAILEKKRLSQVPGGNSNSEIPADHHNTSKGKKSRKKKNKHGEEEYTDKDRAAAVTLGSRDIKISLKAKKKRERKLHLAMDMMNSEEYLSEMLVIEAGFQLRVKKCPRAALRTLNKALELQPDHKAALVARSQCHLKLGDAESALKDAETSFNVEQGPQETYPMGLYWYAEAQYNLGQFERALIAYHRGYRLRKDMDGFRVGIQKAQEAIRRAIGDRSATQIEDLDEILPMIDEMETLKNQKQEHCSIRPGTDEEMIRRRFGVQQPSKARARWVSREVLGQMYLDKEYLTKFLNRPDIKSDQSGSEELRGNANEALNYLEIREQFWRQQSPMYSRKVGLNFNNNMVSQYEDMERERMEASRKIKMDAAEGAVLKNISLIEHALEMGRAKDCQLECDRALRQMRGLNSKALPRKAEFRAKILHYKGLALIKQKKFDQAIEAFSLELNIATEHHMSVVRSRALDHLAKSYALKGSYTDAAEIWETRMAISKTSIERAYIFHEIGRCYMEANKIDIARYYTTQGLEEAVKIEDAIWIMNARILLGQLEIRVMNLEGALEHFEGALDASRNVENSAVMQRMLREATHCLSAWIEKERERAELEGDEEEDEDEDYEEQSEPPSVISINDPNATAKSSAQTSDRSRRTSQLTKGRISTI